MAAFTAYVIIYINICNGYFRVVHCLTNDKLDVCHISCFDLFQEFYFEPSLISEK